MCKRDWKSFHMMIHVMIHIIIHMIIQFQWSTQFKWFQGWAVALKTEHFMLQSHITSRKDQNDYRMMAETNLTKDEAQTNSLKIFGAPLLWQVDYNHSQSISQLQFTFSSPSQHFSYPCCPSKGILPSPAVQTLVSLPGNNWPIGWYF